MRPAKLQSALLIVLLPLLACGCMVNTEGSFAGSAEEVRRSSSSDSPNDVPVSDGAPPVVQTDDEVDAPIDSPPVDVTPVEPPEEAVEQGPTCEQGASCQLSCEGDCEPACGAGAECDVVASPGVSVHGEHEGAEVTTDCTSAAECEATCRGGECAVNCTDADSCRLRCRDAAECALDCTDAGNCNGTVCAEGSECLIRCAGANRCGFSRCQGGQQACGNGVIVCNRDCPEDG